MDASLGAVYPFRCLRILSPKVPNGFQNDAKIWATEGSLDHPTFDQSTAALPGMPFRTFRTVILKMYCMDPLFPGIRG